MRNHSISPAPATCQQCGVTFYRQWVSFARQVKYCSDACRQAATRTRAPRACAQCGEPFVIEPSSKRRFCSRRCVVEARRKHALSDRERPCSQCGKVFLWLPGAEDQRCCSKACAAQAHRKTVIRICQSCGGSFPTIPARLTGVHKALYCSQECRKEGTRRRDERVCPTCGKTFVIPMTSSKNQEHCSAACRYLDVKLHPEKHPLWRGGGGNYYGTLWRLRADEVRERDEETCQDCGKKQHRPKLHVHHLQPRRTFRGDHEKADHLDNLITLCLSCHMKREGRIKSPGKKR